MEAQVASRLAAKLITRSKARKSVDHRKIVNFLDNISRDSTGAPVTWKFNKKGVQFAKGISKKIAKAHKSEIKLKRLQNKKPKMEIDQEAKPTASTEKPSEETVSTKKKPGRKKKVVTPSNDDEKNQKGSLKTDNLIISIRRIDDRDPGLVGTTERIVTINSNDTEKIKRKPGRPPKLKPEQSQTQTSGASSSLKLKSASAKLKNSMFLKMKKKPGPHKVSKVLGTNFPKRGPGKPRKETKVIQVAGKNLKKHLDKTTNNDALKDLEKAVAIKRGRKPQTWTTLNQKTLKKSTLERVKQSDALETHSRESSESRMDSDIESIDSNTSGISDRKRKIKQYHREGINLGPKKLLRSQDSLMTRRKKVTLSSLEYKHRRKRTLSGEFELLDEKSLKKKIRKEEEQNEDLANLLPENNSSDLKVDSQKLDDDESQQCRSLTQITTKDYIDEISETKIDERKGNVLFEQNTPKENMVSAVAVGSDFHSQGTSVDCQKKNEEKEKGFSIEVQSKKKVEKQTNENKCVPVEIKKKAGRPPGSKNYAAYKGPSSSPAQIIRGRTARRGMKSQCTHERKIRSDYTSDNSTKLTKIVGKTNFDVVQELKKENANITPASVDMKNKSEQKVEVSNKRTVLAFGSLRIIGPGGLQFTKASKASEMEPVAQSLKSCEINTEGEVDKNDENAKNELDHENDDLELVKANNSCENKQHIDDLKKDDDKCKIEIASNSDTNDTLIQIQSNHISVALETQTAATNISVETTPEHLVNIPKQQEDMPNLEAQENTLNEDKKHVILVPNNNEHKKDDRNVSNENEKNICVDKVSSSGILSSDICSNAEESVPAQIQSEEFIANPGVASFLDQQTSFVREVIDNAIVKNSDNDNTSEIEVQNLKISSVTDLQNDESNKDSSVKESDIDGANDMPVLDLLSSEVGNMNDLPDSAVVENVESDAHSMQDLETSTYPIENSQIPEKDEKEPELEKIELALNSGDTVDNAEDKPSENILSGNTLDVSDSKNSEDIAIDDKNRFSIDNNGKENLEIVKEDDKDNSSTDKDNTEKSSFEIPGFYFQNIDNENTAVNDQQTVNDEEDTVSMAKGFVNTDNENIKSNLNEFDNLLISSKGNDHNESNDNSKNDELTVSAVGDDKDENSRSSESSLDRSISSVSSKKDENLLFTDSSPEFEGKRNENSGKKTTKRVFQLRQKASRSPLEIIAMKQSQEERQYILEQTQRAMRREEKQKKMKMNRQKLAMEQEISQSPVEKNDEQTDDENFAFETLYDQIKPCSVVLIDFVKYLKMTEKSQDHEDTENYENWEEEEYEESSSLQDGKMGDTKLNESHHNIDDTLSTEAKKEVEGSNVQTPPSAQDVTQTTENALDGFAKKKKRPSARKQARSYNFNPKLTAEIVHYPLENVDYDSKSTVPPLRLKIKQNFITEPKRRGRPGRPAKRKARKSMSPVKKHSAMFMNNYQASDNRMEMGANIPKGFENSYVQFLQDSDKQPDAKSVYKFNSNKRGRTMRGRHMTVKSQRRNELSYFSEHSDILKSSTDVMEAYASHENEMKFECTYHECGFRSNKVDIIRSHIYVHLKNTPFKCLHCHCVFNSRAVAHLHSRSHHPSLETNIEPAEHVDETQYYRPIKTEEKLQNSAVHTDSATMNCNELVCTYNNCGFVSSQVDHMQEHVYLHFKNVPYRCLNCQNVFKSRKAVQMHSRHLHLEMKIEPADPIDVTQYYMPNSKQTSAEMMPSTPPRQQIQQVQQSPEAVIIKVVLPGNVHEAKGCYCCSYCEYSSSVQHEILNHINENHRPEIQYTCSLCDKQFLGNKEGIASHFAKEHPNQPVMYKSMPDFYDVRKSDEQVASTGGPDKGNIFDRISDLFTPTSEQESDENLRIKRKFPEKTSAEADSTTAENEESQAQMCQDDVYYQDGHDVKVDGIEEMVKTFGTTSNMVTEDPKQTSLESNQMDRDDVLPDKESQSEDIGLKIVDVVSLRDQTGGQYADNVWNEMPDVPQSNCGSLVTETVTSQPKNNSAVMSGPADAISMLRSKVLQAPSPTEQSTPHAIVSKQNKGKLDDKCTTYKCEKCNVHAPVLATMVEHLRVSHKDIEKLFLCPYCRQYEGATEPDIHRHIKQFHQSNLQHKSPPVALSSAAKQHLRTIQVPVGDANKIGDKYMIEKDIYKCLKCNGHMPSLEYIYTHLEKQHNEFFVNVCPYCKIFKSKDEEVVFNHIRLEHNRSTDDITLSVAIEENLFTRVQCLSKGKVTPKVSQASTSNTAVTQSAQKEHTDEVMVVGESRITTPQTIRPMILPYGNRAVLMRPNIPSVVEQPLRMPVPGPHLLPRPFLQSTQLPVPNQQLSKSSLRKSRPVHRDRGAAVSPIGESNILDMRHLSQASSINEESGNVPPPLMRAPPPLIRFQQPQMGRHSYQSHVTPSTQTITSHVGFPSHRGSTVVDSTVRGTSFSMTDRLQRLNALHGRPFSPSTSSNQLSQTTEVTNLSSRPVLRVPTIRSPITSPPISRPPPPYEAGHNIPQKDSRPLDLSKPGHDKSDASGRTEVRDHDTDDVPPDAFQIFNIRPGAQNVPADNNSNNYNQFQVRPGQRPIQRMPANIYPGLQRHLLIPSQGMRQAYAPMPNIVSPPQVLNMHLKDKDRLSNVGSMERRIFKCPYCPKVVPLNYAEVGPHIEKIHPGHSIVFSKID